MLYLSYIYLQKKLNIKILLEIKLAKIYYRHIKYIKFFFVQKF